jgi:hypothetical protein
LFRAARRAATRIRFFDDFELAKRHIPPQIGSMKGPVDRERAWNPTKSRRFTQHATARLNTD